MEMADKQWLKELANHKIKGNYNDMVTFHRLKKDGYVYYHQEMYSGQWALTKKGRLEL